MKKVLSILLVLATLVGMLSVTASAASTSAYDFLTTSQYAKVYALSSSGKTIPYTSKYLSSRGSVTYGKSSSASLELWVKKIGIID